MIANKITIHKDKIECMQAIICYRTAFNNENSYLIVGYKKHRQKNVEGLNKKTNGLTHIQCNKTIYENNK